MTLRIVVFEIVGKVGRVVFGKDGNDGNVVEIFGNCGKDGILGSGICNRLRAAKLRLMLEIDKVMTKHKTKPFLKIAIVKMIGKECFFLTANWSG